MKKLFVVVFYPCHGHLVPCNRWVVDEWWGTTREDAWKDKRKNIQEFDTPEEGVEFYRDKVAGGPRVTRYNVEAGKYEGDPNHNISITNSHTICSKCMEARDAEHGNNRTPI